MADYKGDDYGVMYPVGNMGSGLNNPPEKYTGNITGSQFDALKNFFGPSVMGAMMPQSKMSAPHSTVFTVQNQQLLLDLPDVNLAIFMVAETLLASLMAVVNMLTVPIDTKSVVTKEVVFDVGRFVPTAPLVHGPVSGAEAKEQTFDLHRYSLGAQIEWILMLTSAGKTIWQKFMAAIINALRFTWADLIFTAFFAYASCPSMGPRNSPGRPWTEVASMWSNLSLCGTKTSTGMLQMANIINNERHARGLTNNFTDLLVSEEWVRRAMSVMHPSATVNGLSTGVNPLAVTGNLGALKSIFGMNIIVIGDTVKDGLPVKPLRRRIMAVEHHYVEWRESLASRLATVGVAPGGALNNAAQDIVARSGITLCDRHNSKEVFISMRELYSNIAINAANAADDRELAAGNQAELTWVDRATMFDLVIFAPIVYQGDGALAVSGKALTLATTELVTGDAVTNVFSKMLNYQAVVFAAAFAPNPSAVMYAGVSFPSQRIAGGTTRFITRAEFNTAEGDLSLLGANAGILVIAVPRHSREQVAAAYKYGSMFGSVSSEFTRDEDVQFFGEAATTATLNNLFHNVVEEKDPEVFDPSNSNNSHTPLITYEGISKMSLRDAAGATVIEWNQRRGTSFHGPHFYPDCEMDRFQDSHSFMDTSTLAVRRT